eukprot:1743260-Pleurochrysis_carterae.AAC.1
MARDAARHLSWASMAMAALVSALMGGRAGTVVPPSVESFAAEPYSELSASDTFERTDALLMSKVERWETGCETAFDCRDA